MIEQLMVVPSKLGEWEEALNVAKKVDEIITAVNEIEAKLQSASPTNIGYKFADAHAAKNDLLTGNNSLYSTQEHRAFEKGFAAARLIAE